MISSQSLKSVGTCKGVLFLLNLRLFVYEILTMPIIGREIAILNLQLFVDSVLQIT